MTTAAAIPDATSTKAQFNWPDPFDLEAQLSEEERLVRDTAHSFAQEKLMPRIVESFRHERFDREVVTEMGDLGLMGIMLPEAYGGAEMSYVSYGLITR